MRSLMRVSGHLAGCCAAAVLLVVCDAAEAGAYASHVYSLNGSFADAFAGPSMVSAGGTLGPTGYTFDVYEGPNVSNAITPGAYSIEMKFTLDEVAHWKKLLDFKDLTTDAGLYKNPSNAATFAILGQPSGPGGVFSALTPHHMVVTRDGTTSNFTVYVDGVFQFSFIDSSSHSVFSGTNNIIHFLRNEQPQGTQPENPKGFLDYVNIYEGVLKQEEVTLLFNGDRTAFNIPEPATLACVSGAFVWSLKRPGRRARSLA